MERYYPKLPKSTEKQKKLQFMDLPDDILRTVFRKSRERNMLLVNKNLTQTLANDKDIALVQQWLKKVVTNDHSKEAKFHGMLMRGLDPNMKMSTADLRTGDRFLETPLIITLAMLFPSLAKILLRNPDLDRTIIFNHIGKDVTILYAFIVSTHRASYQDDIEYMLETFPHKIVKRTFEQLSLRFLYNVTSLNVNIFDTILRKGFYSIKDVEDEMTSIKVDLLKNNERYKYKTGILKSLELYVQML